MLSNPRKTLNTPKSSVFLLRKVYLPPWGVIFFLSVCQYHVKTGKLMSVDPDKTAPSVKNLLAIGRPTFLGAVQKDKRKFNVKHVE